jgi:hypothetical protein
MNKRQVIILWIVAVVLAAAITLVKFGREKETKSSTNRSSGQTLLESFAADQVASIDIRGAKGSVQLVRKDGKWTVPARDGFPAKTSGPGGVNELLRTIGDLKVAQGMQAGASFAPRFGMDENSKDEKEHGLQLTFKDASGKELNKITVGKNIESANASASPFGGGSTGRFVRNHADESGFYAVSELFSALGDDVSKWLLDDFIRPEKIQSITVTQPGKADVAWKITRDTEEGEFKLDGAAEGEAIEPATAAAFKSLLSFARFEDVVPAAEVGKASVADQKRVATITTFEGFNYSITFTPAKPAEKPAESDPANPAPAPEESYLVKVSVTAEIPKERKKEEGEKPEDAKTKDEAFASRSKTLTEKLEKEKALGAFTFRVGKSSFEHLAKDRATLIKKPEAPQEPQGRNGGTFRIPAGGFPPGSPPIEAVTEPVEAVTPPIQVPVQEEVLEEIPLNPPAEKKD